jgi:hypothetical protein
MTSIVNVGKTGRDVFLDRLERLRCLTRWLYAVLTCSDRR